MSKPVVPGPGTLRVGRFIGRLGVVSLRAVEVGLDLDQRVVRRHVAKLEAAGWLARAPWVWGEGSVVWLTGAGIERMGLGGVRAVKSPPAPTTIAHSVLVGWTAARIERRGRVWKAARELAVDRERWVVPMRCERGYTEQLPDLAGWPNQSAPPVAVIAESGGRREHRQTMILEGWRDAIWSGRYAAVRYDCATASVAHWIARLANKVGLTSSAFIAVVQTTAEQIAALSPAAPHDEPAFNKARSSVQSGPTAGDEVQTASVQAPAPPDRDQLAAPEPPPAPEPETAEAAAERERRYREILGMDEKPRRRWHRRRCPGLDPLPIRQGIAGLRGPPGEALQPERSGGPRRTPSSGRLTGSAGTGSNEGRARVRALVADRATETAGRAGSRYRPRCRSVRITRRGVQPRCLSMDVGPTPAARCETPLRQRENSALSTEPVWRTARPGGCFRGGTMSRVGRASASRAARFGGRGACRRRS